MANAQLIRPDLIPKFEFGAYDAGVFALSFAATPAAFRFLAPHPTIAISLITAGGIDVQDYQYFSWTPPNLTQWDYTFNWAVNADLLKKYPGSKILAIIREGQPDSDGLFRCQEWAKLELNSEDILASAQSNIISEADKVITDTGNSVAKGISGLETLFEFMPLIIIGLGALYIATRK